jgi:hypothetical protein
MSEFDRTDVSKLAPVATAVDPAKPDEPRTTPFGKALTSMPLCPTMPGVARWAGDYWHVIKFALLWAEVSEVAAEAEDVK